MCLYEVEDVEMTGRTSSEDGSVFDRCVVVSVADIIFAVSFVVVAMQYMLCARVKRKKNKRRVPVRVIGLYCGKLGRQAYSVG